jgi:lipoprotein-anchoring transpeptidase ErfK/SrfK
MERGRIRTAVGVAATCVLAVAAAATPAPARAATPTVGAAAQWTATLRYTTQAMSWSGGTGRPLETVSRTRPITGQPTVLPMLARATNPQGVDWVEVLLPGRPNGRAGWITARSQTTKIAHWQIVIRLSTRRVTALRDGRVVRVFRAVVGAPSTPTPVGRFFVEESVLLGRADVGSPYALALSARSNVLQEFEGGPGQIALHGTDNVGGVPGTAVSHGCIRLDTRAITWLATWVGPGSQVTIRR